MVVEFGDFECPFCARFERAFREVKARYGRKVALVFLDDPLSIPRFALPAARAARCAGIQDRFGQYHDALFAHQDSLGLKPWTSYAIDAGVGDTVAFARCTRSNAAVTQVQAGQALAAKLGIRATPTIIVNGWRFATPPSDSLLLAVVAGVIAGKSVEDAIKQ